MKFKEVFDIASDYKTLSTGDYYINMQEKVFIVPYYEHMAPGQTNEKGETITFKPKYYTFDKNGYKEVSTLPLKSAVSNGWFIYNNRTLPRDLLYIRNAY